MVKIEDVFGVSAKQVLSYIERPMVDDRFVEALRSDKQIVVYGSSKQGKTALVSKHLPYVENIPVSVTPKTSVTDIYASILRQAGIRIQTSETAVSGHEIGVGVGARFKAILPFFGSGEAETSSHATANSSRQQEFEELQFNLELPQDVSELLKKSRINKKIILENFHYLDDEKQRQLAFDLRTFQELVPVPELVTHCNF